MAMAVGTVSALYALNISCSLWILVLLLPLVRTPLPYTPVLLPDNFTTYDTYTLVNAHAQYGAWGYDESGDVLLVESYEDKTRNSTISYSHSQSFTGATCTYHVHSVVSGYDSSGEPLGDLYPMLVAPGCEMAVAFRYLLIVLFVVPWLTLCLSLPQSDVKEAVTNHKLYREQFHLIGDGNRRGEGQPPAPDESPSVSRRSAPPSYSGNRYIIDIPHVAVPLAAEEGVVRFHLPAARNEPNPPPPPPAYHQPRRGPRLYLPEVNVDNAKNALRREGELLYLALRGALAALLCSVVVLGLALGSIGCVFGFVNDSGFGRSRQLLWPVWMFVSTMGVYVLLVLVEMFWVFVPLGVAVRGYLREEGTCWRMLLLGSPAVAA